MALPAHEFSVLFGLDLHRQGLAPVVPAQGEERIVVVFALGAVVGLLGQDLIEAGLAFLFVLGLGSAALLILAVRPTSSETVPAVSLT